MSDTPPHATRTIALIGLPGAGKTAIGRCLAQRLRLPFIDSDAVVESALGRTVSDVFATLGEPAFRAAERAAITRLAAGAPVVLATGGGAFVDPATREFLLRTTTVVWLDAPIATLTPRITIEDRPLFQDRPVRVVLEELHARRAPFYAQAHLRLPCGEAPVETHAERILEMIAG